MSTEQEKIIHMTLEEYLNLLSKQWGKGFFAALDIYYDLHEGEKVIGFGRRKVSDAKNGISRSLGFTVEEIENG